MNRCDKKIYNIVIKGTKEFTLAGAAGESIMSIVNSQPDCDYTFPCGGNGRCGKCVIKVLEGYFDVTSDDKQIFNENELKEGYRLACKAIVSSDCVIQYLGAAEKKYEVQSAFAEIRQTDSYELKGGYSIAIDIGTTTIAVALVNCSNGKIIKTITRLNHQRKYGADVIARIQASNDGKGSELQSCIINDLLKCIKDAVSDLNEEDEANAIKEIVISGNTTMIHLLLGYSCETLGVYPFTPIDIKSKTASYEEIFDVVSENKLLKKSVVYIMPGISTYVGGDIASGILHCNMAEEKDVSLLIDLGTNGEMAIGNCDKLLVTSTAAGPAFEGGNISCGTGSIDGAVCDVKINDGEVELKTINDADLTGICGTGVIAVTSELLINELVDETGRLEEDYFEEGFVLGTTKNGDVISFTQKDVREIQLAKAAIRAGAETLILRYGIDKKDISNIYLAGGFGYHIDLKHAIAIGLIAEEFDGRIKAIGNSSLGGAVHVIRNENNKNILNKICETAEEISLSEDRDFQEFYMDYMMFEED